MGGSGAREQRNQLGSAQREVCESSVNPERALLPRLVLDIETGDVLLESRILCDWGLSGAGVEGCDDLVVAHADGPCEEARMDGVDCGAEADCLLVVLLCCELDAATRRDGDGVEVLERQEETVESPVEQRDRKSVV